MPRSIKLENVENFRDLGGYECDFGETRFGNIYRSASLAFASEADIDKIASLGIKTIIDLRGGQDQADFPSPFKNDPRFKVLEFEVNGKGRLPKDREDQVASYLEMLEDPESARRIFKAFINADKPLVFHCNAGKDRTGVFTMMLLALAGVDINDINADYMLSFPYLPKMTKETREKRPYVPEIVITPSTELIPIVHAALLERYGTVENYFEVIGLSEDEIEYLKNLLGDHERSYGAVCFYKNKVLVEHMRLGHYSIPKGHVESCDKDGYATALREIKEETGLDARLLDGFQIDINYSGRKGKVKKVTFYLAEVDSDKTTPQKEEVSEIYFLSPADCMLALTHDSDRDVVAKAAEFYAKR